MTFFSILLIYRGGEYTYQLRASNHLDAVIRWSKGINHHEIDQLGENGKIELENKSATELRHPVLLEQSQNIWYQSFNVNNYPLSIYIVKTDEG